MKLTEKQKMTIGEFLFFEKSINETFPTGIVSLVSDTWNLWTVITEFLPLLKEDIVNRDGKVVLRPDSSPKTPLEIICGDPDAEIGSPEYKGVVELLYEIIGGFENGSGYKELDPHIGMLYGEAISLSLAPKIFTRLKEKGFASNTCFLGIGSMTYALRTRDTLGYALKATQCVVDGETREIFKDPVTDGNTGFKKSAKGLLRVDFIDGEYVMKDQCTPEEEHGGELKTVFLNGELLIDWSLSEIRERVAKSF